MSSIFICKGENTINHEFYWMFSIRIICKIYNKGMVNIKQSKLFPCYSIPMRDYFTSKGIKYELVGLHPKSKDMFWVYIKTSKLEKAMQEWSK